MGVVTEMVVEAVAPPVERSPRGAKVEGVSVIVDAPNVDGVTGQFLGRRPQRAERFDPQALARFARSLAGSGEVELQLFVNVPEPVAPGVEGWLHSMREAGYRVFARPKVVPSDDVDDDMVASIPFRRCRGLLVFSHDARAFAGPLGALAASGVPVWVLGFSECAGRLPSVPGARFVDVDEVPGLYGVRFDRGRLSALPPGGRWLEPLPAKARSLDGGCRHGA